MAELVRLEVTGSVATIRLDRPPMNAINAQLRTELREAAVEARDRDDIRAVVLYGGERLFAAGADIKEMQELTYAQVLGYGGHLQETLAVIARLPKPVIAAITGYALGGGCELALTADFRICADTARLGQPEILLGVIPGAGGTQRLTRLVGPAKAKDLVFSGRFVEAAEALAMGLVDRVVPKDDVYPTAVAMAESYAGAASVALRLAKQAIDDGLETDLDAALRLETALFAATFATEDRAIGMASFVEHGPGKARFVGR